MPATDSNDCAIVPPPAYSTSSLSDVELTGALEAARSLPTWFRAEEWTNTDEVAGTADRWAYIEQVSGPAIGSFSVSRDGELVRVDHLPIIDGHMNGDIKPVGFFGSVSAAFDSIAAFVRNAICPAFLAA